MHRQVGHGGRSALMLAALSLPFTSALAQTPLTPAELAKLAGKVPDQSWYPPGYYDIRIAAEAQVATFPRAVKDLAMPWEKGAPPQYDVIDCGAEWVGESGPEADVDMRRFGDVALEVSRLRSEFEAMRFPPAVYQDALNAFERGQIEKLPSAEEFAAIEAAVAMAEAAAANPSAPADDAMAADDVNDAPVASTEEYEDWDHDPHNILAKAIEAKRQALAPKLPQVIADGGCGDGGGGAPVIVKTSPPGGEIWMISAFAFNVCLRKKPNPWDTSACRWNEIESGTDSGLSGRYVYQVRWPDGFERRGTREIWQDEEGGATTTITLKKKGS